MWHAAGMAATDRERSGTANDVMNRVRRSLVGRERDGVAVAVVTHYGAVDTDARHLVVWLLLVGRPDDQLPEWLVLSPDLTPRQRPPHVDYAWLLELRAEVVRAFAGVGWPDPDGISVQVDSKHRVDAAGGNWNYFR